MLHKVLCLVFLWITLTEQRAQKIPFSIQHVTKVIDEPLGNKEQDYYIAPPKYKYEYEINDEGTGDIKTHKEVRNGNGLAGMYSFIQPDGVKRIVYYKAGGKEGFQAKVEYAPRSQKNSNVLV